MVSKKQLKANRENAKRGGVKTEAGKAITKYNSLKHGLLAKEIVVDAGDGAENSEEFQALISDLVEQFKPEGTIEEILVEKIAVSYWRLRRCHRYEVGLIRSELDTVNDNFYDHHSTDEQIDEKLRENESYIKVWQSDKKELSKMYEKETDLKEIYGWQVNWEWLADKFNYLVPGIDNDLPVVSIIEALNRVEWSDDKIWQAHIELCDERTTALKKDIKKLNRDKRDNKLSLQVKKKLGCIPARVEHLLRYETAIERQLYKALNQLERMQRLRAGDNVPAPIKIDLDLNNPTNA